MKPANRWGYTSFLRIISFLCLTISKVEASTSDTLYFVGKVKISHSETYSYALRFLILSDNSIKGYSLTDARGISETKNRITGKYDSAQKIISFKEQAVLRSKVDTGKSSLCYINAILHIKPNKLGELLTGKFTGVSSMGNQLCGKGEITLYNAQGIRDMRAAIYHTEAYTPDQVVDAKQENASAITKILSSVPKAFILSDREITIKLWDNGIPDGDRVSVLCNGKYLVKNYVLDTIPKSWRVKLPDSESNMISIIPLDEGNSPPNTAMMVIESSAEKYSIELQAKKDETRTLYLRKRKQ